MNPSGKKLMTVFSHPDDAETWSGGTIAKWNSLGGESLITCYSEEETREAEAKAGAKVLGASFITLLSVESVMTEIENFKPDLLITHHCKDSHPEHREVFQLVSEATVHSKIALGKPQMILSASSYNDVLLDGIFEPNVYVDIGEFMPIKIQAIKEHTSQPIGMWTDMVKVQNKSTGLKLSGAKYAEGFVEVPILGKLFNKSLF